MLLYVYAPRGRGVIVQIELHFYLVEGELVLVYMQPNAHSFRVISRRAAPALVAIFF